MVVSSSESDTFGDSMIACTMRGDPSKLSNVLGVTEPDAVLTCSASSSKEFHADRRPALVGYGLLNGNFVLPVRLMMT